jgi:hypothetical protein
MDHVAWRVMAPYAAWTFVLPTSSLIDEMTKSGGRTSSK